jgi:hypothetical protein
MNINIRDIFFNFTVYASFKHTFSVAVMLNFSFLEFFVFFGSFCFFCLPFCHPIGGRDSLKKRKIHQEIMGQDFSVPIKPVTCLALTENSSSKIRINSRNTQRVSNTALVGVEQFVGLFSDISAAN